MLLHYAPFRSQKPGCHQGLTKPFQYALCDRHICLLGLPVLWLGDCRPLLVSSPDQIFRTSPADSSKNRVWTLSLPKLGHVYIWQSVNWVIVGVNYIISYQKDLL